MRWYSDKATDWTIRGSISDRDSSLFSLLQNIQTDAGTHPASYSVCTGVLSLGVGGRGELCLNGVVANYVYVFSAERKSCCLHSAFHVYCLHCNSHIHHTAATGPVTFTFPVSSA